MRILYVGSGAVNLSLAAFLHHTVTSTWFLVRSEENPLIATGTFTCTLPHHQKPQTYSCKAFASLHGVEQPDLVVIGVKNYALDGVLDRLEEAFGKNIPVMSVLNGVSHMEKISSRFSNALFATIIFNAYRKSPSEAVAVGNALALSAFGKPTAHFEAIRQLLDANLQLTVITNPLEAAHCKLVMNLGNALLTIVGYHDHRQRELDVLQKLTATVMNEGFDVLQQMGVKEARITGMPTWLLVRISKWLPQWITVPIFKKKLEGNAINSMAQDVSAGSSVTELEDINGYFLHLADKVNAPVPCNRALYHIFKDWSGRPQEPLTPSELLAGINSFSKR